MDARDIEFMKKVLTSEWTTTAVLKQKLGDMKDAPLMIRNRVPKLCVRLTEDGVTERRTGPKGLSEWRLASHEADQPRRDVPVWLRGLMP